MDQDFNPEGAVNNFLPPEAMDDHNRLHPQGENHLSETQMRDNSAFLIFKPTGEFTDDLNDPRPKIQKFDHSTYKINWEIVAPSVDMRNDIDPEGIRQGINHPAVLADLNTIYEARFAEAVEGGLTHDGFLDRVRELLALRDDPSSVYERNFNYWATNFAAKAKMPDTPAEQAKFQAKAEWNSNLAKLIAKNPNAFLYMDKSSLDYDQHSTAVAVIRPVPESTSLLAFTSMGLVEITALGLSNEDQVNLATVLSPNMITHHAFTVQENSGEPVREYNLDYANDYLDPEDPQFNRKTQILTDLKSRVSKVTLSFKMGYQPESSNINESDQADIKHRLESASQLPWPTVSQPQIEVIQTPPHTPTGSDILASML